MSFMEEIMKIPPVTRFLCASSIVVTGPVLVHLMSPYKWMYVKEAVTQDYEVSIVTVWNGVTQSDSDFEQFWRPITTFFLGCESLLQLKNSQSLNMRCASWRACISV